MAWTWITSKCRWSHRTQPSSDWDEKAGPFSYAEVPLHAHNHGFMAFDHEGDSWAASRHQPRIIRLLRILPSGSGGAIRCHIRVVDLHGSQAPAYDALSYTWGPTTREEIILGMNGKRRHPIICNGRGLLVTENLFNCLHQLDRDRHYGRDLWIDGICVNQEDHAERCQQVSIMADIYRSAERVIVWLGVADENTEPACELINSLCKLSEDELVNINPQAFDNDRNVALLGSSNSPKHWRSLALLFGRTWFTRAWVIQEIVLARNTSVLCGDHSFDWDAMVKVSHFLATRTSANTFKTHLFEDLDTKLLSYKNPTKLAAVKKQAEAAEKDTSVWSGDVILHSLIRCRIYDASREHDKVYSLLDLATPKDRDLPDTLYPNYHRSVARLYTDITSYILENVDHLHVLAHAEGDDFRDPSKLLPSWVPDWSVREELGLRITGYRRFEAAGDLPCFKEIQGDGSLTLRGAQLDIVTRTGATKAEVNRTKDCTDWLDIVEELARQHPGADHEDALWRTLIANTGTRGEMPVEEHWEKAFCVWMGLRDGPSAEDRQSTAAYETAFTHSLKLRLFRTARGHLGLGSQSCKEGDLVWIVQGSRVPLIFRPARSGGDDDGKYRLVGGTYLHGFMKGEALDGLRFGEVTLV